MTQVRQNLFLKLRPVTTGYDSHPAKRKKSIRIAVISSSLAALLSALEYAIKKCFEKGAKVILNPAPAHLLTDDVFRFIHIITPNETEAELLTGIKVTDLGSAEAAANILQAKGVVNVIITLGPKGAYLHGESIKKMIASPSVNAIDTTAAGDVFNGALAVALTEDIDLEQAVTFACKAAAISVTRMGAQSSVPRRSELQN